MNLYFPWLVMQLTIILWLTASIILPVPMFEFVASVDSRRSEYSNKILSKNCDVKLPTHSLAREPSEIWNVYNTGSHRTNVVLSNRTDGEAFTMLSDATIEAERSTMATPASLVHGNKTFPGVNFPWNSLHTNDTNRMAAISDESDITMYNVDDTDADTPIEEDSVIRLKYRNHNEDNFITKSSSDTTIFPPLQTPIVYRYYPRHQSRTISAGSIPFVLLGPNVDHWKLVAQQLSSRGFNVIAVGPKDQIIPTTSANAKSKQTYELGLTSSPSVLSSSSSNNDRYLEGPGLIVQLLDALRWKKIILVGCDSESALAIQAAILLPSDRIAGLILCGNLRESENVFLGELGSIRSNRDRSVQKPLELDRFLHERLSCPFTIVWDGTNEKTSVSSTTLDSVPMMTASTIGNHRSVLIGGGTSPHRRRPGIFAWILTRFVEERIAPAVSIKLPTSTISSVVRTSRIPTSSNNDSTPSSSILPKWLSSLPLWKYPTRIPVLWNVDDMFNEESMVVFGRIVATAIFYAISLKVLVYQHGYIRDGIDIIASTPQQIVHMFRNRISNVVALVVFIIRIPFMILPFGKNSPQSDNSESADAENDSDEDHEDQSEAMEEYDVQSEPKTNNDLRPFFFLDHVVA